jgi:hypothetical protein
MCLDWIQAAFDGTCNIPVDYLAGHMADEMRILRAEASKLKDGGK